MVQARHNRTWVEVVLVVLALSVGGVMLYALLPYITAPTQQVVPPPQQMDTTQLLLMLFVAATAIGAPLTAGIVLALIFKVVSPRVPASSSVAPEIPSPKAKPAPSAAPKDMSPREALVWKIIAGVLLLIVAAGAVAAMVAAFAKMYPG